MQRKGNPPTVLVRMQTGITTMENSKEFPQKTKNRIIIWFINSTPGYISRKNENTNFKIYMHPNIHSRTIHNGQDMEATQISPNRHEWIKETYIDNLYKT